MWHTPTRIAVAATTLVAIAAVWYVAGRGRWRSRVADRLLYGVPWGTLVTVAIVVAFYLLAQGGLADPGEPLTLPFVTWSLFYPTGLLTAGIAHASPGHIASNVAGTLAVAPIAEYVWSHYPPARDDDAAPDGGSNASGPLASPWIRAVVIFPAALLALAFVTALFSLGPGLGFSGVVFAIVGFALVTAPLPAVVAVVAASTLGVFYEALTRPVVREAIEVETPAPPGWAGIGFQAHLLGFLLGVLLGVALLRRRGRSPAMDWVFFATLAVGAVQALWLVSFPAGVDAFVLYRGAGVTFLVALSALVAVAVAGSTRPLPRPLSVLPRAPTRRQLAIGWLLAVAAFFALGVVGAILEDEPLGWAVLGLAVVSLVLALPALAPVLPDRVVSSPVSRRTAAVACVAVVTVLVAAPGLLSGLTVVEGDAVPGSNEVVAGDYAVTYEENVTSGSSWLVDVDEEEFDVTPQDGVVVVSEDRELWTIPVRAETLEYERNATVHVGDLGWRETVHVERTGWAVAGNESAYVVDLEVDGETTRSFASDPVRAHATVDGLDIYVVPTEEGFTLRTAANGSTVDEAALPSAGETATVGDLTVTLEDVDGTERVVVDAGDATVEVAEREPYPQADGPAND